MSSIYTISVPILVIHFELGLVLILTDILSTIVFGYAMHMK